MKKFQIFVSYRREGGDILAGRVADHLTQRGYRVFFDVEALRSGEFNEQIYDAIDGCSDFIMILSPNALDRCKNQGDWVRNELSYALKQGKNIIPVFARGFKFPEELPEDIDGIRTKQGIKPAHEFFSEAMDRLESYLKAKKPSARRVRSRKASPEETAPVKPEIPLPLFLKTSPSSFMLRSQSLLNVVNTAKSAWNDLRFEVWQSTKTNFIATRQTSDMVSARGAFSSEYYSWFHDLVTNFESCAPMLLEKELCSRIHDTTLRAETVQTHFSRFRKIKDYVSAIYRNRPPYYQTRSTELVLLWTLMELSNTGIVKTQDMMITFQNCNTLSRSGLMPLVENVFQGMDFYRLVSVCEDCMLPECKKLSDHPLFREVSFTVEQILKGEDEDAYDGEIRAYLEAVFAMWKIHDRPYYLHKSMKRFLLINYKHLCSRGVELSDETLELFRDFLAACG